MYTCCYFSFNQSSREESHHLTLMYKVTSLPYQSDRTSTFFCFLCKVLGSLLVQSMRGVSYFLVWWGSKFCGMSGSIFKHGWREAWTIYENTKLKTKIFVVKEHVSRCMWGLAIVLVGYGSNETKVWMYGKGWIEQVFILLASFFIRG